MLSMPPSQLGRRRGVAMPAALPLSGMKGWGFAAPSSSPSAAGMPAEPGPAPAPRVRGLPWRTLCALALGLTPGTRPVVAYGRVTELPGRRRPRCCAGPAVPSRAGRSPRPAASTPGLRCDPGPDPDCPMPSRLWLPRLRSPIVLPGLQVRPRAEAALLRRHLRAEPAPPARTSAGMSPLAPARVLQPSVLPPVRLQTGLSALERVFTSFAPIHHDSAETKIRLIYLDRFFI